MADRSHEKDSLLPRRSAGDSSSQNSSTTPEDTTRCTDSDVDSTVAVGVGEPDSEVSAVATVPAENQPKPSTQVAALSRSSVLQIAIVLALGLFTSNLDGSIVMATHPRIASEFNALEESSWIFISFLLAGVLTQVLYAKLSDVYGRKWLLVFCYTLFAIGLAAIGLAKTMWQVLLGRAISGSGGSGMGAIGLVLLTDVVPLREIGTWHGYMNTIHTTGRLLGGPVGGWLADEIGWRWSFLGQVPMFCIAIVACILVVPNTRQIVSTQDEEARPVNFFVRIDFAGILLLGLSILALMLPLELGGVKIPWRHPAVFVLFGIGVLLFFAFLVNELWWARNPVFPVRMLTSREVLACYAVMGLLAAAQTALMFSVPLYFQVTQRVSSTIAGAHLFPAVFGNAVGGLIAGRTIRRTGRYKAVCVIATIAGSFSYMLLIIRWLGNTNWWESLYILFGGLGAGMGFTSIFVSLNAIVDPAHKAVAASGLYLSMPVGMIAGIAVTSAIMLEVMQMQLNEGLVRLGLGVTERHEIISRAAENVEYIYRLRGPVADAVASAYVDGLRWGYGVSLACSTLALCAALTLRNRHLH